MTLRTLPWVSEIVIDGNANRQLLLFAGFGSGPETLRELGESVRDRTGTTVTVAALPRHGGDQREFHESRSWHYLREAETRFRRFCADTEGQVILGGYSTGALLALLLAARHPERIAGLILVSPALRLARTDRELVAYTVVSAYYLLLPAAMLGGLLALAWTLRRGARPRCRTVLRGLASSAVVASAAVGIRELTVPLSGGAPVLRGGEEVLPPHFSRASLITGSTLVPLQLAARWRLRRLARPVCFVFGADDDVVDVRFGTLRAEQTRSAELHVVPNAPHRVVTHEECWNVVSAFVSRTLGTVPA